MTVEEKILVLEQRIRNCRSRSTILMALVIGLAGWTAFREAGSFRHADCDPVPVSLTNTTFQASPQKIERLQVSELKVIDETGEAVVSLSAYKGQASLMVRGSRDTAIHLMADKELASLTVKDTEGEFTALGTRMDVSQHDPVRKREMDNYFSGDLSSRPRLTPEQVEKMMTDSKKRLVAIGNIETGGGVVEVYNPLGVRVVSMQSNKGNVGAVYVSDVNGVTRDFISAGK